MHRRLSTALGISLALAWMVPASAEWKPTRAMKIVVAYTPGGSTDLLARLMADEFTKRLGQSVVVENRSGAGGAIGSEAVARSAPDGHTLLMATNGSHAINVGLYPNLAYDPVKDFAPITEVAVVPLVLVVSPKLGLKTVDQLTAYIKANPGKVSFGSAGVGSSGHIASEMLKRLAGLDMEHVPFRGDSAVMPDLMSGRVTLAFVNLPAGIEFIRNGSLTALAVSSPERTPTLPNVPTMKQAGIGEFQLVPWYGLLAPAGTPKDAIERLHAESVAVLKLPEIRAKIATLGAEVVANTPEAFGQIIKDDIVRSSKVIKDGGVTPN